MRSFAAVSTCHAPGYELYGRHMLEGFERHWPRQVPLHFYCEGFRPSVSSPRIHLHDLHGSCPELVAFKRRHADHPEAHGSGARPRWQLRVDWRRGRLKLRRKRTLGYRWDAVRFSHKVFALLHAGRDVLFLLDADLSFHRDIAPDLLEALVPADCLVGFLARPKFTECGFVAYNLRHPAAFDFLAEYERLYVTDALFAERQWTDAYLFDVVRERFEKRGCRTHDIAQGLGRRVGHVLVESPLGAYMDHRKGERKRLVEGSRDPVTSEGEALGARRAH